MKEGRVETKAAKRREEERKKLSIGFGAENARCGRAGPRGIATKTLDFCTTPVNANPTTRNPKGRRWVMGIPDSNCNYRDHLMEPRLNLLRLPCRSISLSSFLSFPLCSLLLSIFRSSQLLRASVSFSLDHILTHFMSHSFPFSIQTLILSDFSSSCSQNPI